MARRSGLSERFAARLAIALVVGLCFLLMCYPLDDRDIWLHLRTGRLILGTRSIPRVDPYSYTAAGVRWVYPSWLTAVLMHWVYRMGRVPAVQVLCGLVNTAALVAMLLLLRRRGVGPLALGVAGLLLTRVLMMRCGPRPYVFTHLLMAVFVWALGGYHARGRQPYVLIPLMALWSNLHAGFVAGLLLLAPHGLAALHASWRGRRRAPWRFFGVCGAVGLAALLNPYGYEAILHPLRVTGIGPVLRSISEWQGLGFEPATWPFWQFVAATGFCAVLMLLRGRRPAGADVWPALVFFCLTLTAVRHVALCAIVATPLLADALDRLLRVRYLDVPRRRVSAALWLAVAAAWLIFNAIAVGRGRLGLEARCHPVEGVEFALTEGIQGRMLNEFGKGAYILWRAYPKYRVFIDGRLSVYGSEINQDWQAITWMRPNWERLLEKYRIDFILGDNRLHPAYYHLPDWRLVYWDDVSRILVKPTPGRARLIERYECALTCPDTFSALRLDRHGDLDKAMVQLEAKVRDDPGCLAARKQLASCYTIEGRYADAARQLQAAFDEEPNDAGVCRDLGLCLYQSGREREALPYLRRANWLMPRCGETEAALRDCLAALGRRD